MYSGPKNNQINSIFREQLLTFLQEKREIANAAVKDGGEIALNEFCLLQQLIDFIEETHPNYPETPYMVSTMDNFGSICPTQWEGKTKCGKAIYARYRGGRFSLEIDDETVYRKQLRNDPNLTFEEYLKTNNPFNYTPEQRKKHWDCEQLFRKINGGKHSYHGMLSNKEMMEVTKGFLDFSQSFTNFEDKNMTPGIFHLTIEDTIEEIPNGE